MVRDRGGDLGGEGREILKAAGADGGALACLGARGMRGRARLGTRGTRGRAQAGARSMRARAHPGAEAVLRVAAARRPRSPAVPSRSPAALHWLDAAARPEGRGGRKSYLGPPDTRRFT